MAFPKASASESSAVDSPGAPGVGVRVRAPQALSPPRLGSCQERPAGLPLFGGFKSRESRRISLKLQLANCWPSCR
jgi:hypothetical protein